jgi:hypothetical protein
VPILRLLLLVGRAVVSRLPVPRLVLGKECRNGDVVAANARTKVVVDVDVGVMTADDEIHKQHVRRIRPVVVVMPVICSAHPREKTRRKPKKETTL